MKRVLLVSKQRGKMAKLDNPLKNHLLAALPADDFARLQPFLKSCSLVLSEVLYESGEQMN